MASDVAIKLDIELDLSDVRKDGQAIGNILQRALNKNTRTKALDSLERQIGQARDQLRKMEKEINEIFTNPTEHMDLFSFTEDFKKAYSEARKLEGAVNKIVNAARELPELANASISEVADFLERENTRTLGARRTSGKGFVTGVSGKMADDIKMLRQYDQYIKQIEAETNDLRGNEKFEAMGEAIDRARERLQYLVEDYRRLSLESGNSIQNGLQPIINFNNEISQTMAAFSQAFGPYVQIAVTAMQGLVTVTKMEVSALKTMGTVAISAFKPLVSLAQGAAKAISGIFSSIKKHNETTMKNLWRNVLRYGIGVRSMYFLVRKIRAAIGDVINELSKQIPEVNAQMSAFQTAVNGLKGALATAFQPILTAVLPALTALINAVSRAIAVVGKFIALLTGQNFVYAATATQVDYAASLDKTGKSAKKAKKELEGYLSPIDEINKYQSKKDDDTDSGGGGGSSAPYTLKKVPIEDWIKDFWDRIRKAWQTADFFDLGKELGDKIAKALASIPWDKIKNEARRLGKSLATFLNGVMYGEFDGKSLGYWIGHTFAQAINTAFEFVDQFVRNFDWKKLGQTIVDAIKGVFENLDWNLITETLGELGKGIGETIAEIFADPDIFNEMGDALGRLLNALVDMIYNFFNQQSGIDIGLAIARFINSAVDRFDPNDFAAMCNKIMEVILNALITAVRVTKWDKIGEKIAEFINGIDFKMIFSKYKDLANNIIDAILDLLESFLDTLSPDKVTEIGESIADAINGIDFQPERFGNIVNRLLHALLDMLSTAVNETDWEKLGKDIRTCLEQIDWKALFSQAVSIFDGINDGLLTLLGDALRGVFGDIAVNCVKGFAEGLLLGTPNIYGFFYWLIRFIKENIFGIHSPSTVFIDIGKNVIEGFIEGIKAVIDRAKEIWEKLKTSTIEKFQEIKDKVVEKVTALKDKAIELYQTIKDKIIEKVTNLKDDVVNKYEDIKTKVIEKITALKDKAIEIYENIKTKLVDTVTNIKETVVDTWEGMKTSVVEIFESMWDKIKGVINSIIGGVESMVNGIINGLNKAIEAINNLEFDVPGWVPLVGGEHLGFTIPTMNEISLPRLAQGAVIPPNKEFMAVLGDQKSGTNIETPLSTMVEAFNQALRSSDVGGVKQINFLLPDRRTLAQYTIAGGRIIQTSTGKNPFELA